MKCRVILIRHAESISNVNRELSCSYKNDGLSKLGQTQARRTASVIASEYPVDAIYSSPMRRTLITANQISRQVDEIVRIDKRLTEFNFGTLENEDNREEMWRKIQIVYDQWNQGFLDQRFPEGESYEEIKHRLHDFLVEVVQSHAGKSVVLVSHGGVIQMFVKEFGDVPDSRINNCSITEADIYYKEETRTIHAEIRLNGDVNHLNGVMNKSIEQVITLEQEKVANQS